MNIFLIIPFNPEFQDVIEAVRQATDASGSKLILGTEIGENRSLQKEIRNQISVADLIIIDVTNNNPNVMYELGFAQAIDKPLILISQMDSEFTFSVLKYFILRYDRERLQDTLIKPLRNRLSHSSIEELIKKEIEEPKKKIEKYKTVFLSYSHADKAYLERLKIHMQPFEKNGLIDLWVDTKIKAGERWKEKIKQALDKCVMAILLISADFLASDFIVDNELPPLLKSAEEDGKVILPVVLKPCRFINDKNLSQFQAINDPRIPLSKMDDNDREEIYVKIADYVDNLVQNNK